MLTSVAVAAIAIVASIILFIILSYKGLSPILAALLAAVIVGFTCEGGVIPAIFDTFVNQSINFIGTILLLFVMGGLFSAVLDMTGTTEALANGIVRYLGEKSIPFVIFLISGVLCYLGVGAYQFIVAALAFGLLKKANMPKNVGLIAMLTACNAVVYCLPGTTGAPNIMPTTFLNTTIYAGAGVGIMAFIIATALGLLYVYWMAHSYVKQGIGYEQQSESMEGIVKSSQEKERKLPPFWTAIATLLILFAFSAIFTFVDAFGFDSTQAVIFAQIIAALWACLINLKFIEKGTILSQLTRGVVNVLPIAILMGFISGFGAVVQTTSAFGSLLSGLLSLNISPYLLTFIGIAIMSACLGNGTSAMVMVLNALSPVITTSDVNYNLIHRIATTTASTTDSMPHCPNVCVAIQAFGLTHKKSYKHVFFSTVCIPLIYAGAVTVVAMLIG